MTERVDMLQLAAGIAHAGADTATAYLRGEDRTPETAAAATQGLKALGIYSRIRATRANEAGIVLAATRAFNLPFEVARPILEEVSGQSIAAPALADSRETSGGEAAAA